MKAPQEIIALVARFDQNFEAYQSGQYQLYTAKSEKGNGSI